MPVTTPPAIPDEPQPRRRRWSREEYYLAAEKGLFRPEEHLELINGEVIEHVSPQGTPHAVTMLLTSKLLETAFSGNYNVRTQLPITLSDATEPEPDIVIVSGGPRDYEEHHPTPPEVLLLVEISDTTLTFDRTTKATLYANACIPEYWIINLAQRRLEVYRNPLPDGIYGSITTYEDTGSVSPLHAPAAVIRIVDLLPTKRNPTP